MPYRAPKPCSKTGCSELAYGRYCQTHQYLAADEERIRKALLDQRRGSSTERGYGGRWRRYRLAFLRAHPLCAICQACGIVKLAAEVDHIVPHRGDMKLFWKHDNHQGLCKPCHSRKTATEDSGFARSASLHAQGRGH